MPEPSYLHAVRTSYDTAAVDYAALLEGELAAKALDRVEVLLTEAGFAVHARLVREPEDEYERTPQGFVLARRR